MWGSIKGEFRGVVFENRARKFLFAFSPRNPGNPGKPRQAPSKALERPGAAPGKARETLRQGGSKPQAGTCAGDWEVLEQ